jgi:uncharacterized FlaG/YvyC family protein
MDTKVTNPASVTPQTRAAPATTTAPIDRKAAVPEKVETPQAVPAADTVQKPVLTQTAPNSALTTYKDQDSGRLIVRVFDRESGDVLVEFPPEKAFRAAAEILESAAARAQKD